MSYKIKPKKEKENEEIVEETLLLHSNTITPVNEK
jgi:hypothetical protein